MSLDAMIQYLETHPLLAVGLVVLVVLCLGSLIRKLVKAAFILLLIFLAGLYWTHREASSEEWKARLEQLKEKGQKVLDEAAEMAKEKGKEALEKGKKEVEKQLKEKDK